MYKEILRDNTGSRYSRLATKYLVDDLLVDMLTGEGKSQQMTAMDMESDSPDEFVPSMFYTFMYVSDPLERAGGHPFYDMVPLLLCTSVTDDRIYGLNFNLLPNSVRADVLDILYESYRSFYDGEIEAAVESRKFALNKPLALALMSEDSRIAMFRMLDAKTGVKVSGAYRTYSKKGIMKPRMIEYDVWKYIPFLSFRDAIRGANLAAVQAAIVANK